MSNPKEDGRERKPILIHTKPLSLPLPEFIQKYVPPREVRIASIPKFLPHTDFKLLIKYVDLVPPEGSDREPRPFADHLKDILKKEKLSQTAFANVSNVDHADISMILSHDRGIKSSTLVAFSQTKYFNDEITYQIIMDSVPIKIIGNSYKFRFINEAPVLIGNAYEQLFGYRRARELTQRQLAERTLIDHSTISRLEKGNRNPNLSSFASIAYVLGLNQRQTLHLLKSF